MKLSASQFYLLLFIFAFSFMFHACQKEKFHSNDEIISETNSSVENPIESRTRENCSIDYNDISFTIEEWNSTCDTVTITGSLCCECVLLAGPENGCTINGGTLSIEIETGPFIFTTVEYELPSLSIPAGTCYDFVLEVYSIGGAAFIGDVFLDDEELEFDFDQNQQVLCD